MKVNVITLLVAGAVIYFIMQPKTETPFLPEPEPLPPLDGGEDPDATTDEPLPEGTAVDVYDKFNQYHHTEITYADGTIGIYRPDENGDLQFVMMKPQKYTTSAVSGIAGKRCNGDAMGEGRTICGPKKRKPVTPKNITRQALL